MTIQMIQASRCAGKSITQNLIFKGGRGSNKSPVIIFDELKEEKAIKPPKVKLLSKAIRQAIRGY